MLFSKTPYRISFFGGGTDYPEWHRREGGAVVSTTIDKYCYISCRHLPPFFNEKHRIVWSHIETVSSIAEILHPAVREGLTLLGFDDSRGLEIHHQGDLPARSGMGSSSSFSVGLLNVLTALRGGTIDRHALALKAIELEQDVLKENVGSQDQVAAAYGGFNRIDFATDGAIRVEPVRITPARRAELEAHLLLVFTGASRLGSEVAAAMKGTMAAKADELRRMRKLVDEALGVLEGMGPLAAFGELLHRGWELKRGLSARVTNPKIDAIYDAARAAGATGGKLLGAGATGFMVFFAPPEQHDAVRRALPQHLWVPFRFSDEGSRILLEGFRSDEGGGHRNPPPAS